MEHMINSILNEISATKNTAKETPPKLGSLCRYITNQTYKNNEKYRAHINKKFDDLRKRTPKDFTIESYIRNYAINFWNNEHTETIKEMKVYIDLSVDKRESSFFHEIATGLWIAWTEGYIVDNEILELISCVNEQILATKQFPSIGIEDKKTGGAPLTADEVETLMCYVHHNANTAKSVLFRGKSRRTISTHLTSIIGDEYRNILMPDHKYYEIAQVAYKYWLVEHSLIDGG